VVAPHMHSCWWRRMSFGSQGQRNTAWGAIANSFTASVTGLCVVDSCFWRRWTARPRHSPVGTSRDVTHATFATRIAKWLSLLEKHSPNLLQPVMHYFLVSVQLLFPLQDSIQHHYSLFQLAHAPRLLRNKLNVLPFQRHQRNSVLQAATTAGLDLSR
jgi:hypothetical protein